MTKKPYFNAIAALAYIVIVTFVMDFMSRHASPEKSIIMPIAILSLLTLSAAVMGYLFAFQPILLYLDGEKKASVKFFIKTLVTFAVLTVIVFLLLALRVFF